MATTTLRMEESQTCLQDTGDNLTILDNRFADLDKITVMRARKR